MRIIAKEDIASHLDSAEAMRAIKDAFVRFDRGEAQIAPVIHLDFPDAQGECHVKSGHIAGDDVFVIKVATGFYNNAALGLGSSNGFMAVMSARTGEPLALLCDGGMLTDVRTALAGVLATCACASKNARRLGVIGSGVQARLQALHLLGLSRFDNVRFWARSQTKLEPMISELKTLFPSATIEAAASLQAICEESDALVTATAATVPMVKSDWIGEGVHITAVGADSPGKQELDTALFARAAFVVADSIPQCIAHGETANAIAAQAVAEQDIRTLGGVLADGELTARQESDITIADLTGVAVQDVVIAKSVWMRLCGSEKVR